MRNSDKKKNNQLGMLRGTARNKLIKSIMFDMAKKLDLLKCYQCSKEIVDIDKLSIEHKIPWLDSENPVETYFDLENIAFSHKSCNSGAARTYTKDCITSRENRRSLYPKNKWKCRSCNEIKLIDDMVKDRRRWSGLDGECKKCKRERS